MKHVLLALLFLACIGCEMAEPETTPVPQTPTVDKKTSYSSAQKITFASPLKVPNIHPETLKIIEINGSFHLITSFADLFGTTYDYFRSFKIDTNTGLLSENTTSLLGEYKEVGFPKSPFYYEDLNGDGYKDLFVSDHGKETPSLQINGQFPGYVNHLFYGNATGTFKKATIDNLTTALKFHHNSAVGDLDQDGDKDLIVQSFTNEEMELYLNDGGTLNKKMNINPQNQTGSVLIADMDGDGKNDVISAPYIDRSSTPATYIQKINLTATSFTKINASGVRPFGDAFGCYKIIGIANAANSKKFNFFYFVESGVQSQKIFRSKDNDPSQLEEVSTVQSTAPSNNLRDYQILDLNFDGLEDILFITNTGEPLVQRVWLNKGGNIFENPTWDIDSSLKDFFLPISKNETTGKMKFLYFNGNQSQVVEVYTKK
jgi:hypothetical protein